MIVKMNIDCSDAIPRQSRIVKQNSEPGDFMKDGEKGTVLDYFKVIFKASSFEIIITLFCFFYFILLALARTMLFHLDHLGFYQAPF